MPYFKDTSNKPYFLDDSTFANLLPPGCVAITDAEADAIRAPSLALVKAAKLDSLVASRKAAATANVTAMGKTFRADMETQTDFKRLGDRLRRGKPTKLAAILDATGNPVTNVTQALMDSIEDAIADNTENAWNKYGALVAQVNAATDVAMVNAIVW